MKFSLRILAVLLVFAMAMPLCVFAENETPVLLENNKYYKMLVAFGIVDEADSIANEEFVTRSLLAKYTTKLFGPNVENATVTDELPFEDISGDENVEEILVIYNRGMLSGTAPGMFSPEGEITMAQAAKLFVTALGYGVPAQRQGGYPMGYVSVAGYLDILDGVSSKIEEPMSSKDFVRMLYNALTADVMQLEGVFRKDSGVYDISNAYKGESVLSNYYGIYKYKGLLEVNEYASVYGLSNLSEDCVSIGKDVFFSGNTNAFKYIGQNVMCYYKENEKGANEILYIESDEQKNSVYNVMGYDVMKDSLTLSSFVYRNKNGKTEKLELSDVATLIYNSVQEEMDVIYMCPESGEVTLVDNNLDQKIDVVIVDEYESLYVTHISANTYTVIGESGDALSLDPENDDCDFHIEKDGIEISFEDITENCVVSYTRPLNPSKCKYLKNVRVSDEKTEGKVDVIDAEENKVLIGDVWYSFLSELNPEPDMEGTFYMDYTGVIVHYEEKRDFVYGYLCEMGDKSAGLSSQVEARLLSEKGNWIDLDFADKVLTNGGRVSSKDFYSTYGDRKDEIVRYNVNEDGEIREMLFAQEEDFFSDTHVNLIEQKIFHKVTKVENETYYNSVATFNGVANLVTDTVLFLVSSDYNGISPEEHIEVVDITTLRNNTNYPSAVAYDVNQAGVAKAAVVVDTTDYATSSGIIPVKSIVGCIDENGNEVYGIRGYFSGDEYMTVCVRDTKELNGLTKTLKPGDLIRCSINKKNEIIRLEKLLSTDNYGTKYMPDRMYASSAFTGGFVVGIDYSQKKLLVDCGSKNTFGLDSVGQVWIYDREDGEFTVGGIADIQKGNYIYMRTGSFAVREIVVYK